MSKILLIFSFLAFSCAGVAQTATEFFHRGAQFYVFGEKQKAMDEVAAGLTLYPTNQPLNDLAALLKREDEQEQQQQQQQQNQSQENQNENQSQDGKGNEQNSEQQQQQNEPTRDQQDRKDQEQTSGAEEKPESQQQQEPANYAAGQMTPDQAERLLDAQKGQEMLLPVKREQPGGKRPLKDW